jgi:phage-related protein
VSNVGYATLSIIPSAKGFGSALDGEIGPSMTKSGLAGGALLGAGAVAAVAKFAAPLAAALGIASILKTGFQEAADAAAGSAQLAAGIASTGNAANVSVESLNALASSIQLYSGQTDDSIVAAEKLLLTFTNIRNVGADKIFDRATIAAADMAARMGGDASGSAIMLGKALNDPIAGLTTLGRAGVQFSDAQKDSIKAMVAAGDTMGAQKLILGELETQFGGSARAAGEAFPGQLEILKRSFEDFSQMIVQRFLPGLGSGVSVLSGALQKATPVVDSALSGLSKTMSEGLKTVIGAATGSGYASALPAAIEGPLIEVGANIGGIFRNIVAAVAPFVPTIISAFSALGPQLIALASNFSPFGIALQALMPVLPAVAGLVAALAAAVGPLLGTALSVVTPIVGMLVDLLSGTLAGILPILTGMIGVLGGAFGDIAAALQPLISAILPVLAAVISALFPIIDTLVGSVLPPVADLFGVIVGAIAPLISTIADLLIPIIDALLPVVTLVFNSVAKIITSVMQIVQGVIQVVTGVISGNWGQVWTGILNIFSGIWETLKGVLSLALSIVVGLMTGGLANAQGVWTSVWNSVSSFFSGIWSGMIAATAAGVMGVISWFTGIRGQVLGALAGAGDWLVSTGRNMIEGLIRGVQAVAGKIAETVLAPIRNAVNGVKSFLGIHSPSRLFMEIGGYTGEGMALGLESKADRIADASEALIPETPSFRSPDVALGGVAGALAASSGAREGDHWTIEYNDHSTSHEDKQAKLLRAQTVLEQSVAARRGR